MALGPVTHVTVYVNDQQAAREFYEGKLGFSVTSDEQFGPGMRWLTVLPPGGQTDIALWPGAGEHGGKIGGFTGIVLKCTEIDATYEDLKAKGVNFTAAPSDVPWGRHAMLADPDGHEFNIVQH